MSQPHLQVGWIGLGSMGLAMASNIQRHLLSQDAQPIRYWNRTISRGDDLKANGGIPCSSIADVVHGSGIIFISVSDDSALTAVVSQIASSPSATGKTIVDTTTVHPSTTTSISAQLTAAGASYIAAPVFGATPTAQAGQLLMAIAGPAAPIADVSPLLQGVIARSVIHVGTDPADALLLKTTSNFITAGLHYVISEAHTLAEKTGLAAGVLEELIERNFGDYAGGVSRRLTSGAYMPAKGSAPASGLELGMKDVEHGLGVAAEVGMRLEVGALSMRAMKEAKEYGDGRGRVLDSSSVYGIVRREAGLDFETETVKGRDAEAGE